MAVIFFIKAIATDSKISGASINYQVLVPVFLLVPKLPQIMLKGPYRQESVVAFLIPNSPPLSLLKKSKWKMTAYSTPGIVIVFPIAGTITTAGQHGLHVKVKKITKMWSYLKYMFNRYPVELDKKHRCMKTVWYFFKYLALFFGCLSWLQIFNHSYQNTIWKA